MFGIFVKGKLDCDPEPMVFETHEEAVACMQEGIVQGIYDRDEVSVDAISDVPSDASRIVTIRADGKSSYKVTITDLVRELGLDIGDQVRVTVKKL